MSNRYAVYVSDARGWPPAFDELFFGERALRNGGKFVPYNDGGEPPCGHIEVQGRSEAIALKKKLNNTGDWLAPDTGKVIRPTYAIKKLSALTGENQLYIEGYTDDGDCGQRMAKSKREQ